MIELDPDPLSCITLLVSNLLTAVQHPSLVFLPPSPESILAIIVALLGLFLSAFNSGSEIAFFSLKKTQIDEIDDEPVRERIKRLLRTPEKLLATILIGNNLINVMIIIMLNYALSRIMIINSPVVDFIVQTVILSFLILLFGEIIPKLYATSHNVKFASVAAAPLLAMVKFFSPLSQLMVSGSSRIMNSVVSQQPEEISTDDLSLALEASEVRNEDEKELLEGILTFGEKTVSEIMRPRIDVVDIDINSTWDDVVNMVVKTGYSRMPVYDETPDNIKGILYAKDLLPYIGKRDSRFRWQSLIRPAYFVPETRMIDDLLEDFRRKKTHMAIIVDEYGCTQGIATLEDVLEEIVGEIADEYDTEEKFYTRIDKNTYNFDGKTLLSDFCRVLDIDDELLGEHGEEAETLAGLLLDIKGDFFKEKEELEYGPFEFKVLKMDKYRIAQVQVKLQPQEAEGDKK